MNPDSGPEALREEAERQGLIFEDEDSQKDEPKVESNLCPECGAYWTCEHKRGLAAYVKTFGEAFDAELAEQARARAPPA